VLPGDFPDPSVTKIGNTYWATATSSEWAPLFPLLRSDDLVHWETVGHVFPKGMPKWADANFWAPEIAYENGKVYIYYTAHKKGGNLCVGVASADRPEGPTPTTARWCARRSVPSTASRCATKRRPLPRLEGRRQQPRPAHADLGPAHERGPHRPDGRKV
jgi:hypothetical protein